MWDIALFEVFIPEHREFATIIEGERIDFDENLSAIRLNLEYHLQIIQYVNKFYPFN
jgi:hypothetical protein